MRERAERAESERGRGSRDPNGNVVLAKKVARVAHSETAFLSLTVLLAALAMLSKEQGVTVLGLCFLNDLLRTTTGLSGEKRRSLATLAVSAAALLALRARAMGFSPPHFAREDIQ